MVRNPFHSWWFFLIYAYRYTCTHIYSCRPIHVDVESLTKVHVHVGSGRLVLEIFFPRKTPLDQHKISLFLIQRCFKNTLACTLMDDLMDFVFINQFVCTQRLQSVIATPDFFFSPFNTVTLSLQRRSQFIHLILFIGQPGQGLKDNFCYCWDMQIQHSHSTSTYSIKVHVNFLLHLPI